MERYRMAFGMANKSFPSPARPGSGLSAGDTALLGSGEDRTVICLGATDKGLALRDRLSNER